MPPTSFKELDVARARQIDKLCDRFEQAWLAAGRPQIEDYLPQAPAETQKVLLWELVRVELWHRRAKSEQPTPAEYRRRFAWAADLNTLFAD